MLRGQILFGVLHWIDDNTMSSRDRAIKRERELPPSLVFAQRRGRQLRPATSLTTRLGKHASAVCSTTRRLSYEHLTAELHDAFLRPGPRLSCVCSAPRETARSGPRTGGLVGLSTSFLTS